MCRLFALLALLFVALAPQGADARAQHPHVSSFCPLGAGTQDGCGQSPIVTKGVQAFFQVPNAFQPGGFFNTTAATPTNYMLNDCGPSGTGPCRQPFNVVCVEFGCGPYTPFSSLLDPATVSIPGCSYSVASWGAGLLTCGGTGSGFTGTVAHLNRGPIGGHHCTALVFNNTPGVSQYTLDDDYFFNDTGGCAANYVFLEEIIGTGVTQPLAITNAYEDGNAANFPLLGPPGGCPGGVATNCNSVGLSNYGIGVSIKYSYVAHFAGRTIPIPVTPNSNFSIQYSMVDGWLYREAQGHGEWALGGVGIPYGNFIVDHVVSLGHHEQSGAGEAPLFINTGYPLSFTSVQETNNTFINPWIGAGGLSSTVTGCIGAAFSGGNCTGTGNVFFVTALTGTLGVGQGFNCNHTGLPAQGVFLDSQLSGPGTGFLSSWSFDGGIGELFNPSIAAQACDPVTTSAQVASIGITTLDGNPITSGTIENNYTDMSSMAGYPSAPGMYSMGGGAFTITGSISGTTLTTSASTTLLNPEFINGAGVTGCSTSITDCPQVAGTFAQSQTGTSFTLTTSGGTVASETLTVTQEDWCLAPIAFSGNVDMGGLTSNTVMNKISGAPLNPGSPNYVSGC